MSAEWLAKQTKSLGRRLSQNPLKEDVSMKKLIVVGLFFILGSVANAWQNTCELPVNIRANINGNSGAEIGFVELRADQTQLIQFTSTVPFPKGAISPGTYPTNVSIEDSLSSSSKCSKSAHFEINTYVNHWDGEYQNTTVSVSLVCPAHSTTRYNVAIGHCESMEPGSKGNF
jgi:hypothetical protein